MSNYITHLYLIYGQFESSFSPVAGQPWWIGIYLVGVSSRDIPETTWALAEDQQTSEFRMLKSPSDWIIFWILDV